MTINNHIKDEKLQYDINRKVAKISALSPRKLYKYEYLTGEDILPSNQQQMIEQTKFTLGKWKAFEKQIKAIEDQGKKTGWCFRKNETRRNKTDLGYT